MNKYEFIDGNIEFIDYVKPLWEKLNDHHRANSNYFDYRFLKFKFDDRKNKFINDNNIDVKIDLIKDTERDLYIGYCISTINKDLVGEIDSLFIEVEYRKYGFGDQLMHRALEWLNKKQAKIKRILVAEGNENVLDFYKKYDFYKKSIVLEQKN